MRSLDIFTLVKDMLEEKRNSELEKLCGEDAKLRRDVEELLAALQSKETSFEGILCIPESEENKRESFAREEWIETEYTNFHEGKQIGNFTLVRKLGKGGVGEVWLAEQFEPVQIQVAIKFLHVSMKAEEWELRFKDERKMLASLDHPNIARFYDAGITDEGQLYLVMEVVGDGRSVSKFCQKEEMSISERLHLFLEICNGVIYINGRGHIHRDLSSKNVLVKKSLKDNVPKIIDFGFAKNVGQLARSLGGDKTGNSIAGIGTRGYISPEQQDRNYDVDMRTDVYSLGAILYNLLVKEDEKGLENVATPLLSGYLKTLGEKEKAQVLASRKEISFDSLCRKLEGDLNNIVTKAVAENPNDRYKDVSKLAEDIDDYLHNKPVSATPNTTAYVLKKYWIRKPGYFIGIVTTITLLMASFGAIVYWAVAATNARERAEILTKKETKAKNEALAAKKSAEKFAAGETKAKLEAEQERKKAADLALKEKKARKKVEAAIKKERLAKIKSEERRKKMLIASQMLKTFYDGLNPEIASGGDGNLRAFLLEQLKRSSVEILKKEVSEDEDVLLLKESLANALTALGEQELSVPVWENITKEIRNLKGENSIELAQALANLGKIYWLNRRFQESKEKLIEAKKIASKIVPSDDPTYLRMEHYFLKACEENGEVEFAYKERIKLKPILEKHRKKSPDLYLDSLHSQGQLEIRMKKFKDSLTTLKEADQLAGKILSERNPIRLVAKSSLALAYGKNKEFEKSANTYMEILEFTKKQYPPNSEPVGVAKINLAVALIKHRKYEDAEQIFEDVVQTQEEAWIRYFARLELAMSKIRYLRRGKEGFSDLRELVKETAKELGEKHYLSIRAKTYLKNQIKIRDSELKNRSKAKD